MLSSLILLVVITGNKIVHTLGLDWQIQTKPRQSQMPDGFVNPSGSNWKNYFLGYALFFPR
jgi:hypothetical protein